ncbi:MAG TPA: hypothetical protein VD767_06755 [Thermomicrobiales bacterium]|nr:hypothetical protein [Thermomicrobiales bacterium]
MTSHVSQTRMLAAMLVILFAIFFAFSPAVDATPRQPSVTQKGENHKAECKDLGGTFESGTYTDADDPNKVTNYSTCTVGDSMVICEWTATTDFCLGAIPGTIRNGGAQLPSTDQFAPLAPATPTPTPPVSFTD